MIRAYLFALDPTAAQTDVMMSHCGGARVAYNWCLARVHANWDQRQAEESYGISVEARTPWMDVSAYALKGAWNAAKADAAPWWAQNSKEAYSTGCENFARAMGNYMKGRARLPRFKSKHKARFSCRFSDSKRLAISTDGRHVKLPVLGWIRTHESTRKLTRHLRDGSARIRTATLSWQRGRWHVSFSVEVADPQPESRTSGRVVGVDLGVQSLAVLSTGRVVPSAGRVILAEGRLRRAHRVVSRRRGPDRRTRAAPSKRWDKARARAARIQTRVANLRRDQIAKLSTRLANEHEVIVIEDLNVTGMVRNRHLARSVSDASFGEFRRQLTYKCEWYGAELIVADRWFPSSKTCSNCGTVKAKLSLSERTYKCDTCGMVMDRDLNAAKNLAALASKHDTGELRREQPAGTNVRPATTGAVGLPREVLNETTPRREAVAASSAGVPERCNGGEGRGGTQ